MNHLKQQILNFKSKPYYALMLVILITGFIVRIYGINFGKPYLYHVDEWKLVNRAGHLLDIKNFEISTFLQIGTYPPFFPYILAVAFGIYSAFGLFFGIFPSISYVTDLYKSDPFTFHLIGRYISAVMGTATILLTYIIGKITFNRKIGIIGALFLAFTFIHVRNSHYSTVDIPVTFFVAIALIFITLIYIKGELKYYILAGVFCAVAVATKFTVAMIVFSYIFAHVLKSVERGLTIKQLILNKNLWIGFAILFGTFLILCPFPILNFYFFLNKTSEMASTVISGRIGYYSGDGFFSYVTGNQWNGFGHVARNSLAGGIGVHMMLLCAGGVILSLFKFSKKTLLFLSFPVIHFILLSSMSYKAMRNMLPVVPHFSILASFLIYHSIQVIPQFKKQISIALIICSILCVSPMLIDCIENNNNLTLKETRTIAKAWIENNIPLFSKIAIESKSPQLFNTNPDFTILGPRLLEPNNEVKSYHLVDTGWFLFSYAPDEPVDFDPIQELEKQDVEYVILDNWTYDRFYLPNAIVQYPIKTGQRHKFYHWVRKNSILIKEFEPIKAESTGPRIEIYKLLK